VIVGCRRRRARDLAAQIDTITTRTNQIRRQAPRRNEETT